MGALGYTESEHNLGGPTASSGVGGEMVACQAAT
jgi:hypothetical protein